MNINIEINDDQAKALAAFFQIKSYTDGNDLGTQVTEKAALRYKQRTAIQAASETSSTAVLDAMIAAAKPV